MTAQKCAIISLLFFAKIFGRIVGVCARTQTRLLTQAQSMGWKPTDHQAFKLMRRQQQLFQFKMARKQIQLLRNKNPALLKKILEIESD